MRIVPLALVVGLLVSGAFSASAAPLTKTVDRQAQPSLVALGVGQFDSFKGTDHHKAVDMRFDYRGGMSLLSALSDTFKEWDRYVQFHPEAGIETSSKAQFFTHAGLAMDVLMSTHVVFTPSFAMGPYIKGNGKDMGNGFLFRSGAELGYRFDNDMRASVYWSYLSNLGLAKHNPGAQSVGVSFHVPVQSIVGTWQ